MKTEGACSDKPMERLKTDRDGYRVPQKDADAAKARILAKTKKKRQQAKENIMKGALLPQSSDNSMLDSVEEQALQMIERTRYAKETGKDFKTGNKSEKGGTRDGKSAFDKVSREMRKTGGVMSSRGNPIQPQGKKKQPGKKGYKGVTPCGQDQRQTRTEEEACQTTTRTNHAKGSQTDPCPPSPDPNKDSSGWLERLRKGNWKRRRLRFPKLPPPPVCPA